MNLFKKMIVPLGNLKITNKYNFLLIITTRSVSKFGTAIFSFALSIYVLDITNSAYNFSLFLALSYLSGAIAKLIAGPIVDKYDKKNIFIFSDILSGVAVLLFMMLFISCPHSISLLMVYNIILPIIQSFYMVTTQASIPIIVPEHHIAKTNSFFQAIGSIVGVLGPVIGVIAYRNIQMETIFLLNGISFLLSSIGEVFIKFDEQPINIHEDIGFVQDVKMAFRYLKSFPILELLIGLASVTQFFFAPLFSVVVPYISYKIINVSEMQLSIIQGAMALGVIIGTMIITFSSSFKKFLKYNIFLLIAQSGFVFLFVSIETFQQLFLAKWYVTLLFSGILVAIGILNILQLVPLMSTLQLLIPQKFRGKILSLAFSAMEIFVPLGMYIYGVLLDKIKWSYLPAIAGISIILICIYILNNKYYKEFIKDNTN